MSYIYIYTHVWIGNHKKLSHSASISHDFPFFCIKSWKFSLFAQALPSASWPAVAAVAAVNVGRQLQPARLATFGRQVRHAADAARQLGQLDVLPRWFDNL